MPSNYSVVIAADRTDKRLFALEGLAQLPPGEKPGEVFVCVGRNPSNQRNKGVKACHNPLVYFLDDDSRLIQGSATHLLSHFEDPRTAVAGGPNLVPPDAIPFEKTVNSVLSSWMGSFSVRYRYASLGAVREDTEKELILCNMMVRRETFLKEGGFRTDLYPNEENEFLNRLMHKGYQLVYDPRAAVYRSRRKSLWAFCYQAFRYGRGRARQMKVYPCFSDLIHLAPAFFVVYLLSLLGLGAALFHQPPAGLLLAACLPLALFILLAIGTGVSAASWHRRFTDSYKVPILIFFRHFFYGLGLFAGFSTAITQPPLEVKVFRVKFGKKKHLFVPLKKGES